MIADQIDGRAGSAETLATGLRDSELCEFGSGAAHLGESAEVEKLAQAGLTHFVPADAREVPGDQAAGDTATLEARQKGPHAGTNAMAQIGTDKRVVALRLGDDCGHPLADALIRNSGMTKHATDDIAIQHSGDRDALAADRPTSGKTGCVLQGQAVVRARLR